MTDKIKSEDFIKAFGSGGVKEPEHHIITDNIMEGYESPISLKIQEIATKISEERDNRIIAEISEQMGVNVDKYELARALAYDRDQYRKGFEAAWLAREKDVMTWIPVSKRLPDDLEPVNITWINHCPEPYYKEIKDKPFTATGVYFNGQWYWWSTLCADTLAEYSHNFDDVIDASIEVTAWMPLPEPYKKPEQLGGEEND